MKTNIPWNNYCMRKYGSSIRKEIERTAKKVIIGSAIARTTALGQPEFAVPGLIGKC